LPAAADAAQQRFFALVSASNPDVIVLDFSKAPRSGAATILTVRRRSAVPILVVCDPAHPLANGYRKAGASECISAPVDPLCLSQAVRRVVRVTGNSPAQGMRGPAKFSFAGMSFQSERNLLVADDGSSLILTNLQARLLAHFLRRPSTVFSRAEIGELLYGRDSAVSSRAAVAVVNRLRKRLASLVRSSAQSLIKTKARCGYWLAADVTTLPQKEAAQPW
jgi:two-component system, OmpR family, response regulator